MTIEIKPLQFPSWEEFYDKNFSCYGKIEINSIRQIGDELQCRIAYAYSVEWFSCSKQGYKEACEWLKAKRLELIQELCRGD